MGEAPPETQNLNGRHPLSSWDGMGDPPGPNRGDPFTRTSGQQQLIFGSNTKILASPARSYV